MAFLGAFSKFEERVPLPADSTQNAMVQQFRRLLFEDFGFIEAARRQSGLYEGAYLNVEDFSTKNAFKDLILENPHGVVSFSGFTNRPVVRGGGGDEHEFSASSESEDEGFGDEKQNKSALGQDVRMKRFSTRMSVWPPFSLWANWILSSKAFEVLMILVIVLSSLLMCLEGEIPDTAEFRWMLKTIEGVDFFLLLMFGIEISLKWMNNFQDFWKDPWNLFDFVVTAASFLTPIFDVVFPESNEDEALEALVNLIKYIRIARILRTLNVVTRVNKVMVIWRAILRTFGPLLYITVLMLFFFFIFAIFGVELCDRFSKTHVTNLRYVDRFTSLPYALLTLFQIFTIDHWHPILRELMEAMKPEVACCYILAWLLLGTFIFKNIFAGVMVNNFQNIRDELVDETLEIEYKSHIAEGFNAMEIDELEEEILRGHEQKNWEMNVFHALDLIKICDRSLSPALWPRDTLFHYFVLLEAMAANMAERDQLLFYLNQALLQYYSS